ncbi:MAG: hypothetical protein HY619_04820 [Thaumarchaeota archaeon]|nr:hypothetical protein [Nitrososphaerota archaeon]
MQTQYDLSKGEAIEFSVKSEPWVKYKLEDGTSLFGRLVITKIVRMNEYDASGQPVYAWLSQNLFSTLCSKDLKGTPSTPPPTSPDPKDFNVSPIDFERIGGEQWNIYEFSDGSLLRIKLEVTNVLRTDKYTFDGDPYYIINTQTVSRIKVPSSLLKKPNLKASAQQKDFYR